MFNEIEDLMQAIDKFKSNMANSEELLLSLKNTNQGLEQLESTNKENQKKVLEYLNDNSKKVENIKIDIKNESDKINLKIEKLRNEFSKKFIFIYIGIAILLILIIIFRYL